jgi:hypothetical protein
MDEDDELLGGWDLGRSFALGTGAGGGALVCEACGTTDVEVDDGGDVVCLRCATVMSQSARHLTQETHEGEVAAVTAVRVRRTSAAAAAARERRAFFGAGGGVDAPAVLAFNTRDFLAGAQAVLLAAARDVVREGGAPPELLSVIREAWAR